MYGMRKWITWIWWIEKKLWGDALHCNRFFASLLSALSLLIGASLAERELLQGVDSAFAALNGVSLVGLLVLMVGFVLCESFCAGNRLEVVALRALMVSFLLVAMSVAGYLLGVIALAVAAIWLLMLLVELFCTVKHGDREVE